MRTAFSRSGPRRFGAIVALLLVAAVASIAASGLASASTSGGTRARLVLKQHNPATVSGTGFKSRARVRVTFVGAQTFVRRPVTNSQGAFTATFPTAVDRFITLWEIAGEVISDPIIKEATDALKTGTPAVDTRDPEALVRANRELLTLHELIAHRIVQILLGLHRGRAFG